MGAAVGALGSLGATHVFIDSYAARMRIGLPGFDAEAVRGLRDVSERLGGALSIERVPPGVDLAQFASEVSPDEIYLSSRLERVFDPGGVLWRCLS